MEVQLRRFDGPIEADGIRIKVHGNEYLLKQVADGLHIIEITDDSVMIRPQTANSIVIVTKNDR